MAVKRRTHTREDKPVLRDTDDFLREMERVMRKLSYRHSVLRIFQDFVELSAISMSNAVDLFHTRKHEERYIQRVKGYTPEEWQAFPKPFGMLAVALEYELSDVLGVLSHRLEMHNWLGKGVRAILPLTQPQRRPLRCVGPSRRAGSARLAPRPPPAPASWGARHHPHRGGARSAGGARNAGTPAGQGPSPERQRRTTSRAQRG